MDIQLKRGLLDVCVLAAIRNEDSYGYRIIKDMKPYLELSESTLYTILKRLETANMLTVRSVEHEGRLRKYYHITQQGINRIEEFRDDWQEILSIYQFINSASAGTTGAPTGAPTGTPSSNRTDSANTAANIDTSAPSNTNHREDTDND